MHFRQCKIFSSASSIKGLENMINEWLNKHRNTIRIKETNQSESCYASTNSMPSMHTRTITIWYEQIPS
jgi:hypothetical protein